MVNSQIQHCESDAVIEDRAPRADDGLSQRGSILGAAPIDAFMSPHAGGLLIPHLP